MHNYHHILGVAPHATLEQIKRAYRRKAKLLHPDISKEADAKDQFILLNEAYEYLLNTTGNNTNSYKRAQERAKKQAAYQKQWEQEEREKARRRAQEYARMKYEAYIKSDAYKATEAINMVVDFIATLFILLMIIGIPVLAYKEHGPIAIVFSIVILLPTSPLWFRLIVRTVSNFNFRNYLPQQMPPLKPK